MLSLCYAAVVRRQLLCTFFVLCSSRSIDVEENVGTIPLAVRRSQGAFGAISVQWQVNSGSATSVGECESFANIAVYVIL